MSFFDYKTFRPSIINSLPTNQVTYNQQKWVLNIILYTIQSEQKYIILDYKKILGIQIIDQMGLYGQSIQIVYIDTKINKKTDNSQTVGTITSMYVPNNTFLYIYLKQPLANSQQNIQIQYNGDYMISEIQVLQKTEKEITYRITGTHVNYLTLLQNIDYATNTRSMPVPAFEIVQSIFNRLEYPIASLTENFKGKPIHFITYKNMRVMDIIQYCLSVSTSIQHGIYFFVHNMLQNKAYLINQNSQYNYLLYSTHPENCNFTIFGQNNTQLNRKTYFNRYS